MAMEWLESRLLRSARPFVPSGIPFGISRSPSEQQVGNESTEDDQAMLQMMCDLVLGEIQGEINRVERETVGRKGGVARHT